MTAAGSFSTDCAKEIREMNANAVINASTCLFNVFSPRSHASQHASPLRDRQPSLRMIGTITRADIGSAHHSKMADR